jgi:hypothetical protein
MSTNPITSPKKAIANHCKGCIYDSHDKGNWLQQVEGCTITDCSLYHHRPLTAKTRRLNSETRLALLAPAEREIAENNLKNTALKLANARASRQAGGNVNAI